MECLSLKLWGTRRTCLGILTLVILLASPMLQAQVITADIIGTVTDPSGAVMPGVTVTVRNGATGLVQTAVTDNTGTCVIRMLPPGKYSIKAELQGFKTATIAEVNLAIGDRLRQDMRLEIGSLQESVEVTAAPPALQTDSSSLGSLVTASVVQDLPLNGRNFVELAQLVAGANPGQADALSSGTRPDDRRRTSAISVNAQDPVYNNFLLDGMDDNERFIGTVMVKPSVEVIQEMKIQTSLYPAELGRTSGGVVNFITKSGTNKFHGSLFEFLRNEKLDARNFFSTSGPKPVRKQNNFGGSLGGPIVQDRTFFFVDYEALRNRDGKTLVSTVPTLAMRNGNFSGVAAVFDPLSTRINPSDPTKYVRDRFPNDTIPADRIDAVGKNLINLLPLPQTSALVNNFQLSPKYQQDDDTFDVRIDHRFSDKNNIFGRYSFNNTYTLKPGAFPLAANGMNPVGDDTFSGTSDQRAQNVNISDVHTFSSKLVLEVKGSGSRYHIATLPPNFGKDVANQIGIKGANVDAVSSGLSYVSVAGYRVIGDPRWLPIIITNNVYQGISNLIYMTGKHSYKFGVDLRLRQVAPTQSQAAKGRFDFDGNLTNDPSGSTSGSGNSFATLLLGYPYSTQRVKFLVDPYSSIWEWSTYAQDDWRVLPWLTLNIGVRYDYYGQMIERYDRIANGDIAKGLVLVAGKDGVSRSAGLNADKNNIAPRFGFAASFGSGTVLRGGYGIAYMPSMMASVNALRNPPFTSLYGATATVLTPANKISDGLPYPSPSDPKNPNGPLNFVGLDNVVPYFHQLNLTLQQQIPWGIVATVGYSGVLGRHTFIYDGGYTENQAPPGAGSVQARRRMYGVWPLATDITTTHSWNLTNYHSLQMQLERRYSGGLGLLGTYTYAHAIDDMSSRLGAYVSRKMERGNSYLDMRHRFTFMVNYDLPTMKNGSGFAKTLVNGWKINAKAISSTGLAFDILNASARSNTGGTDRPNLVGNPILDSSQQTVQKYFNTSAFALQPLYTFGNLGRNILHAPGFNGLDLSLNKDFKPMEGMTLQFRMEAFNIMNHPNFGTPGNSFGSSTFGVISSAQAARNIQFALKVLF